LSGPKVSRDMRASLVRASAIAFTLQGTWKSVPGGA
jgi:hypothetical protein